MKYYLQGFQTADAYQFLSAALLSCISECCILGVSALKGPTNKGQCIIVVNLSMR